MRNRSRIGLVLLAAAVLLAPGVARAEQIVAVLAFGGDDDGNIRGAIIDPLFNRYKIIHGDKVLDACDEFGIPMSRGRNLARCAQKVNASAVVGGAVQGGKLSLVVFSGGSGNVLVKGSVACRGRLSKRNLRRAVAIVLKGLRKAPRKKGRAAPPKDSGSDFSFDPDPVDRGTPMEGQSEDLDEDPLTGSGSSAFDPDAADPGGAGEDGAGEGAAGKGGDDWPKFEIMLGVGSWIRSFGLNDPRGTRMINSAGASETIQHPQYNSGGTFALRLGAKVRPAAFFSDGFMKMLYVRLHYMTVLGLQSRALSRVKDATGKEVTVEHLLSTSFWEFMFDLGLDWNILDSKTSPHLVGGIGFGTFNFNIDWAAPLTSFYQTKGRLPDVGYRFVLLKLGVYWPFLRLMDDDLSLGAHFNFDGRPLVSDAGEVEDATYWYGAASTGGIALGLGIDVRYIINDAVSIVAGVEYTYSRYFYTFSDAEQRLSDAATKPNIRVAGGALDELHGIIVNVGYAY